MSLPRITWHITCAPEFVLPARYTITMLGMIAGFRAEWAQGHDDGPCVCWGCASDPATSSDAAFPPSSSTQHLHLPADRAAQEFLLVRGSYDDARVQDVRMGDLQVLSLFRGEGSADVPDGTDLIASAFFFLSLHEEWSSNVRDGFDRMPSAASLLGRLRMLHRPVVAEMARALRALLRERGFPVAEGARWDGRESVVCMTHDVDYVRKLTPGLIWREVMRNAIANDRRVDAAARWQRLREFAGFIDPHRDPYRVSLRRLLDRERQHDVRATWFFKAGVTGRRDVRYALQSTFLKDAYRCMHEAGHEVGLHPSFNAHLNADVVAGERSRLEAASGRTISVLRQHYLRFHYPRTWRMHAELGVEVDSTLGFADHEGFRAGMCHPFLPFDLERRRVLPLVEIPLHVMDGTLAFYRGRTPAEAQALMFDLLDVVHAHEGVAVVLFHNTCDDAHDFAGWSEVADAVYARVGGDARRARIPLGEAARLWLAGGGWSSAGDLVASLEEGASGDDAVRSSEMP